MDTLGCFQGLPIGSRLTPLGVPPKKIPNPSIKITLKRWIPMTTTPPFRPTPLPALYESLQAPLTVLSSASKKRLPVDICRFLKKNQSSENPKKSHRFSVIFRVKSMGSKARSIGWASTARAGIHAAAAVSTPPWRGPRLRCIVMESSARSGPKKGLIWWGFHRDLIGIL